MTPTPAEIAARTIERIRAEPDTHQQRYWFLFSAHEKDTADVEAIYTAGTNLTEWRHCGYVACAAGHAVAAAIEMGAEIDPAADIGDTAAELLYGVDDDGVMCEAYEERCHDLFWPGASREAVLAELARIACGSAAEAVAGAIQ